MCTRVCVWCCLCLCRATRGRARSARLSRPGHSPSQGPGPVAMGRWQLMGRGLTDLACQIRSDRWDRSDRRHQYLYGMAVSIGRERLLKEREQLQARYILANISTWHMNWIVAAETWTTWDERFPSKSLKWQENTVLWSCSRCADTERGVKLRFLCD